MGYRILRSFFRDTGYSPKIETYQMFDEKRSWITKTFGIAAIDNHVNVSSTHRSLGVSSRTIMTTNNRSLRILPSPLIVLQEMGQPIAKRRTEKLVFTDGTLKMIT